MNTNVTCETCRNEKICKYSTSVTEKARKIEEMTSNGPLRVHTTCTFWEAKANGCKDGPEPVKEVAGIDPRWNVSTDSDPSLTMCGPCLIEERGNKRDAW